MSKKVTAIVNLDKLDADIPRIEVSDQVKDAMASDPKLAEALKALMSSMRNAAEAVKAGRYKSFDDAMEDMTGHRPQMITKQEAEEEVAKAKTSIPKKKD